MDYTKAFYDILEKTSEIALATSVDNMPNVRSVMILRDNQQKLLRPDYNA